MDLCYQEKSIDVLNTVNYLHNTMAIMSPIFSFHLDSLGLD